MQPTIGYNLRMIRFKKNLTQSQVSQAVGISLNSLSRYENDERTPGDDLLFKFAEFYNVPISMIKVESHLSVHLK